MSKYEVFYQSCPDFPDLPKVKIKFLEDIIVAYKQGDLSTTEFKKLLDMITQTCVYGNM